MAIEVFEPRTVERIERNYSEKERSKLDKLIDRETRAKSPLAYAKAQLQIIKTLKISMSYLELVKVWEDLVNRIDSYNKLKAIVELDGWKGKDKLTFIEKPDSFEIIQHRKRDQDSKPQEIKKTVMKEDINSVILAIGSSQMHKNTQTSDKYAETPEIAKNYCKINKLTHNKKGNPLFHENGDFEWQFFFSDRGLHCNINIILRLLDFYNIIKYRAGQVYLLNKNFKFQTTLKL